MAGHDGAMTGSELGPFRVLEKLGEGGMGQVFRAHDSKLRRDVALKVLPDLFAEDHERLTRFEREAQVLASLNHPNIAHLYGIEEAGTKRALVMELVSGPTLADRIAAGPMPIDEVLSIARQIAEALEAAHEQGIVHRDLKPANVKVREDGLVKVLDFGLAKALDPAHGSRLKAHGDLSNSPTITSPAMTAMGLILGTAAYMSPEQAKGRAVDKRADIWAFGVVLYEMLAGRMMFAGENVSDTLAHVILKEPDWSGLPPTTPPSLRDLLSRCLVKDPRNRLRDIGDARIALLAPHGEAAPAAASTHTPVAASRRRERVLAAVAGLAVLTLVGVLVRSLLVSAPPARVFRFDVYAPGLTSASNVRWLELSPDGRYLAFSTTTPSYGIYVRPLDSTIARLVGGTEASSGAPPTFFWSPDSQHIGYFAALEGKLKKVAVTGGPPQVICELPLRDGVHTGTWNADGVILFHVTTKQGPTLWRVSAAGGQAQPLHDPKAGEPPQAFFPAFLPDGRHYLALAPTSATTGEAFVGELDSTERRPLPGVSSFLRYDAAGHLLFARAGSLLAQPFDVNNFQLSGEPRVVAENVADSVGGFSVSANGVLAFRAGTRLSDSPLVRFDRSGQQLRSESLTGSLQAPNLSREGNRLAIERTDASNTDVWIIDLVRGTNTRITDDPGADIRPVFSPDGTRVAFSRQGAIYLKSSSGTGTEERLVSGEATDWSPDGKVISFIGGGDLWTVSLDGDRKPVPLVETKGNDRRGRFSPDGKWIAYETDVNGRLEIYVQRFPPTPERVQVSVNGGSAAYWRSDGKELFFTSSDQTIMAVDVTLGAAFQAGTPRKLFDVPGVINNRRFVVTPDGKQILVPVQKAETAPITVVLNWATTLGP